jgi:hypothetical protein
MKTYRHIKKGNVEIKIEEITKQQQDLLPKDPGKEPI